MIIGLSGDLYAQETEQLVSDDMTVPPQIFMEISVLDDMITVKRQVDHNTDPDFGGESHSTLILKLPYNSLDSQFVLNHKQITVDYHYSRGVLEYSSSRVNVLGIRLTSNNDHIWLKGRIELKLDQNPFNEETRTMNLSITSKGELKQKEIEYKLSGQPEESVAEDRLYQITELEAEFPGGPKAMLKYFQENLIYPDDAKEMQIQGRVFVSAVVEKDGTLSNVELVRGVYSSLDKEAVRVVKGMPKWIPGEIDGKTVRSRVYLPLTFKIQ